MAGVAVLVSGRATMNVSLDNPFFRDHFHGAVEREMTHRGFTETVMEGDVPDLRVHNHAKLSPQLHVNTGDSFLCDAPRRDWRSASGST